MRNIVLLLTALLFLGACAKKYKADALPENQLRWGHGGGFTGQEITSLLLRNGQVFKSMGYNTAFEAAEGIKKKDAKKIFGALTKIDLSKLPESKPGNRYKFLDLPDGKGKFMRIAFEEAANLPDNLRNLYEMLPKADFKPTVLDKDERTH